jgi:hypothetical protein
LLVRAKKPFAISGIECEDKRFEFNIPEGTRTAHVIPFTFRGELLTPEDNGNLKQKVVIKTSLGEEMVAESVISGRVVH